MTGGDEPTVPIGPHAGPGTARPGPAPPHTGVAALRVFGVDPAHGSRRADPRGVVTARFSEAVDEGSMGGDAFRLVRQGMEVSIPASVAYDAESLTATLRPESGLERGAAYTAVLDGGPTGIVAVSGLALAEDVSWSFTTRKGPPRWILVAMAVVVLAIAALVVALLVSRGDEPPGVQPTALDFGDQPLGARGPAQQITVTNRSRDALVIGDIALSGADPADFVRSGGTCAPGASLAKDASCTTRVSFAPAREGSRTATLTIGRRDDSALSVPLAGTGTGKAVAAANVDAIAFGSVTVGGPSVTRQASVANQGNVPLSVVSVRVSGSDAADFAVAAATTCSPGSTVPAGGRCLVAVTFTPSLPGDRNATLELAHGATGTPLAIGLSGAGASRPEAGLAPGSADLGQTAVGTTTAPTTFTMTNLGTADLPITSISFTGASPRSFVVTGAGTCAAGATLRPGSSCTITVAFAPSASGSAGATLSVAAGGTRSSATVTGVGVAASGSATTTGSSTQPAP